MAEQTILQIMPSDGWRSLYVHEEDGEITLEAVPLVGWALVEDGGGLRYVVGLDSDRGMAAVEENNEDANLVCYIPAGEDPEEHRDTAMEKLISGRTR